jgi:flagellar FliL protein
LLLLFSRQDASTLATADGKQKLVDEIKQTLARRW